jgi:hypothetical protein
VAELQPCGTYGAYQRHKLRKEEACEPCKRAHSAYKKAWRDKRRKPPRPLRPCGTIAAYRRHQRHGTEICAACRKAHREYYWGPEEETWADR